MIFRHYYLKNSHNQNIYYIGGELFYTNIETADSIHELQVFNSKEQAEKFAKDRKIQYDSIGEILYTLS